MITDVRLVNKRRCRVLLLAWAVWATLSLPAEALAQTAPAPSPSESSTLEDAGAPEAPAAVEVPAAAPEPPTGPEPPRAGTPPPPKTKAPAPPAADPPRRPKVSGAPGKGLTVEIDDAFSLNVKLRFQVRGQWNEYRNAAGRRQLDSLATLGTARIYFSGHAYRPELQYGLQLAVAARDYRDSATSPIFDAFLDWKAHRDLAIKGGQYFVPLDRLRTVREFALQMADRPVPVNELSLDRDVGVTFYSERFLDTPLAYRLGAFGGGGNNLVNGRKAGGLLVGRLELRPLGPIDDDSEGDLERRKKPGLAIGVAAASNWNTNRARSTTGATFRGGTTDFRHFAADLVFKAWGLAVQGEYLRRNASFDAIQSLDEDGAPLIEYTRSAHGFVAQASYTFAPPFEIVGRLSRLYALPPTDPAFVREIDQRGQEVGAGANYYVNGHKLKFQADWIARMPHDFDIHRADHAVYVLVDVTL
jgi:hypothetical protein